MILEDLYSIKDLKEEENNTISANIDINDKHIIFKGHFPNRPVMPGVCLTNMITDVISAYVKEAQFLQSADFIKFINLVIPSETYSVKVLVKLLSGNDSLAAEASIVSGNTTFLKLKGNFARKAV
jgi:3-hydroxyacyl-[acyl-carrier-protein] dehydratase